MKLFEHILDSSESSPILVNSAKRVAKEQAKKAQQKAFFKLKARLQREALERAKYGCLKSEL